MKKILSLLSVTWLLPLASHAAAVSPTNIADVTFQQATLREATSFLTERFGLKLLLPEHYAEVQVTLSMKQASPPDALAAIGVLLACEWNSIGWKETTLTGGQKAYVLSEVPPVVTKSLLECAKAMKQTPRMTMEFRQARMSDVAAYIQRLASDSLSLVYAHGLGETPVDLKLKDVSSLDALMALNELMKASGMVWEWRGVPLPSGRLIFALMNASPASSPQAGVEGVARAYFVGDLGRTPGRTSQTLLELLDVANLRADVSIHEETRMLIVKGNDEVHALVKNVVEELRRGAPKAPAESEPK
jgi:hypothetical protein